MLQIIFHVGMLNVRMRHTFKYMLENNVPMVYRKIIINVDVVRIKVGVDVVAIIIILIKMLFKFCRMMYDISTSDVDVINVCMLWVATNDVWSGVGRGNFFINLIEQHIKIKKHINKIGLCGAWAGA